MDSRDPIFFGADPYDQGEEQQVPMPPLASSVVVVASGKGGVGKSTISLNVALALAETGASVGLLDADVYAPDIPLMLNLTRTEHRKRWPMYRNPRFSQLRFEPVERLGIKVMSAGFLIAEDQSLSLPGSSIYFVLNQLARQVAWGRLDYLLVDLPPGTADVQQHVVRLLRPSGALIVVGPQDVAHLDAKKVLSMFREAGVPVLGGIENMRGFACPHCQAEVEIFPTVRESRAIWAAGVERLAQLPFEPKLAQVADQGRPLLVAEPDSAQAERFRAIATRLAADLRDG